MAEKSHKKFLLVKFQNPPIKQFYMQCVPSEWVININDQYRVAFPSKRVPTEEMMNSSKPNPGWPLHPVSIESELDCYIPLQQPKPKPRGNKTKFESNQNELITQDPIEFVETLFQTEEDHNEEGATTRSPIKEEINYGATTSRQSTEGDDSHTVKRRPSSDIQHPPVKIPKVQKETVIEIGSDDNAASIAELFDGIHRKLELVHTKIKTDRNLNQRDVIVAVQKSIQVSVHLGKVLENIERKFNQQSKTP